jgi:hypothetical protein
MYWAENCLFYASASATVARQYLWHARANILVPTYSPRRAPARLGGGPNWRMPRCVAERGRGEEEVARHDRRLVGAE